MVDRDGTEILRTQRLRLRTFTEADLPLYAALNADPPVAEMLGGPLTRAESDEIAEWANGRWAAERLGLLAVERLADGAFLGMCGLHHLRDRPGDVEIGWRWPTSTGAAATRPSRPGPGWRTGSGRWTCPGSSPSPTSPTCAASR